jgi:hypothetical protein
VPWGEKDEDERGPLGFDAIEDLVDGARGIAMLRGAEANGRWWSQGRARALGGISLGEAPVLALVMRRWKHGEHDI